MDGTLVPLLENSHDALTAIWLCQRAHSMRSCRCGATVEMSDGNIAEYKMLTERLTELSAELKKDDRLSRWNGISIDTSDPYFQALADHIRKSFFASQKVWGAADRKCEKSGNNAVNFWSFCDGNLLSLLYQDWAALRGGGKAEDVHRSKLRPIGFADAVASVSGSSDTGSGSLASATEINGHTSAPKRKAKKKEEHEPVDALLAEIQSDLKCSKEESAKEDAKIDKAVELQLIRKALQDVHQLIKFDPLEPFYKERLEALKAQYRQAVSM